MTTPPAQGIPASSHKLFERYPITGQQQTSTGLVPVPYHVYDGTVLFVGGTGDLKAVRELVSGESVHPLETTDHKALLGIWICDFTEASLGPHHELQFSVFVTPRTADPVPAHPLSILKLIAFQPETLMLCYRLWNSTPTVVAYNRELLGLDAALAVSHIQPDGASGTRTFEFLDSSGASILKGQVKDSRQQDLTSGLALMRLFGLSGSLRAGRAPWVSLKVVNPISQNFPANLAAQTFTSNARQIVRLADPQTDRFEFGDQPLRQVNFLPTFVNIALGCKFIYLNPVPIS